MSLEIPFVLVVDRRKQKSPLQKDLSTYDDDMNVVFSEYKVIPTPSCNYGEARIYYITRQNNKPKDLWVKPSPSFFRRVEY